MYALFGLAYIFSHADPILITKIAAPILYSALGSAEYRFARRALKWRDRKSLSLVLITSVYFAPLALSWDLFRNTLGMIFLFPALTLSHEKLTLRKTGILAGLSWLVVASHLLVGTILLGILLIETFRSKSGKFLMASSMIPGILQLVSSLLSFQLEGKRIISFGATTLAPLSELEFLLLVALPLLPVGYMGLRRLNDRMVVNWSAICLIGALLSLTPLLASSELVDSERWALMLAFPALILATEGLSLIDTKRSRAWLRPAGFFKLGWVSTIVLLGMAFLLLPASQAFPYFTNFTPTSMLQSTIPLEDSQSLVTAISWLTTNSAPGAVIMADHAMYGWIREFYRGNDMIIAFSSSVTLQQELSATLASGYRTIYTVWWTDHFGWYGEPSVPTGFGAVKIDGRMGIFLYVA